MQDDGRIDTVYLLQEGYSDSIAVPITKAVAIYKHIAEYWTRSIPKSDERYRKYQALSVTHYVKPIW